MASAHTDNNFADDHLLTIKNIGFKVRDLALSCFEPSYAAFDLHVARVPTRIGLLNYGFELLGDPKIEMGNNPTDEKNHLFLHRLFLRLSELTENEISPAELDRIFWHFGRTCCGARPRCGECPVNDECLTGKHGRWRRQGSKVKRPHNQGATREAASFGSGQLRLPYGGPGASFPIQDLVVYVRSSGRKYIIIGGANCTFAKHRKQQSLDYWLRSHYTDRKDMRQTTDELIEQVVATGLFQVRTGLICQDSGRRCRGLALTTGG
jgi:hypothetical protein